MQMIGHDDVTMDKVVALIAIMKDSILHNRGNCGRSEQTSPLPRVCRDEVRRSQSRPVFRSSHLASGAEAPPFLRATCPAPSHDRERRTCLPHRRASSIIVTKSSNKYLASCGPG